MAKERQARPFLAGLLVLTFGAGLVDAASVLGLGHIFTANMTGNLVFLGFALSGVKLVAVPESLLALGSFMLGALAGGRLSRVRPPRALKVALALEVALLALAGGLALAWPRVLPLLALLGGAMGLRNAVVRQLAVPDMTTTVLTMTVTGLAADSSLAGGDNPRWRRRIGAVASMLFGALSGAALLKEGLWVVIAAAALVEAAAAGMLLEALVQDSPAATEPILEKRAT
ncbi:MAG TPA: YoaK family protein [Anaeromyxobacteraceae bacterium]|nr:YoaK family protein [Anaeromyxobacteraceae bacterium]